MMESIAQEKNLSQTDQLLENFADLSDKLLRLGIITTDSFTGEIGEYIACKMFGLNKAKRSTQAVDGTSPSGERYQVKAKVVNGNYSFTNNKLESKLFDFLVIVYFDKFYTPQKIIRIPSKSINSNEIRVTDSNIKTFEDISLTKLTIPVEHRQAINSFGKAYNNLIELGVIRSRRIVGDIGEFYACSRLGLKISDSCIEKGYDARHPLGYTFEIKTRRVYESDRRISQTRRLNNLVGKNADFLVVVTLDRLFKCSGMWLLPMKNIENKKSANLSVVNKTIGSRNLTPSRISYLTTGKSFSSFEEIYNIDNTQKISRNILNKSSSSKLITSSSKYMNNIVHHKTQQKKYAKSESYMKVILGLIILICVIYVLFFVE